MIIDFTPKDWKAVLYENAFYEIEKDGKNVLHKADFPEEAEINSRLLQAAPEMYELLCDIFNNPLHARLHKKIDKVLKKHGI